MEGTLALAGRPVPGAKKLMWRGALRTAKYAWSWRRSADVHSDELEIGRNGARIPATIVRPRSGRPPYPAWIALGGVSCMGRHHPQLVRFSRAVAASGAVVLVPEVPEWRRLELAPDVVAPTLRGCIEHLKARTEIARGPFGLIGFSFGAPQVAIAAGSGYLEDDVAGIVLFGGYCSLERTMTCQLVGEHEWQGIDYRLSPDPFGGWVVGSNHLLQVAGCEGAGEVVAALRRLAMAASGQRISAWDPRHDELIRKLRCALPARHRRLFDLFAAPSGETRKDPEEGRRVALLLADACRRAEPLLDPGAALSRVSLPTRLIHGRGDRLIPFTEGFRLHERLPAEARRGLTVTAMFNHSADSAPPGVLDGARERLKMLRALHGMLGIVP